MPAGSGGVIGRTRAVPETTTCPRTPRCPSNDRIACVTFGHRCAAETGRSPELGSTMNGPLSRGASHWRRSAQERYMSKNAGGYWHRLVRRFTSDVAELDADDLSERSQASGAQRACDCNCGEEAVVLGRLRSVGLSPKESAPTLEAELFDGT